MEQGASSLCFPQEIVVESRSFRRRGTRGSRQERLQEFVETSSCSESAVSLVSSMGDDRDFFLFHTEEGGLESGFQSFDDFMKYSAAAGCDGSTPPSMEVPPKIHRSRRMRILRRGLIHVRDAARKFRRAILYILVRLSMTVGVTFRK